MGMVRRHHFIVNKTLSKTKPNIERYNLNVQHREATTNASTSQNVTKEGQMRNLKAKK